MSSIQKITNEPPGGVSQYKTVQKGKAFLEDCAPKHSVLGEHYERMHDKAQASFDEAYDDLALEERPTFLKKDAVDKNKNQSSVSSADDSAPVEDQNGHEKVLVAMPSRQFTNTVDTGAGIQFKDENGKRAFKKWLDQLFFRLPMARFP